MKINITYQPGEEKWAFFLSNVAARVLREFRPKVKESKVQKPYQHIYISSKPPKVDNDIPYFSESTPN